MNINQLFAQCVCFVFAQGVCFVFAGMFTLPAKRKQCTADMCLSISVLQKYIADAKYFLNSVRYLLHRQKLPLLR